MPTQQQIDFMRRAIALATANVSAGRGGPFGAVIVRDGQLLAEAANSVTETNDPTAHAEVNAIRLACRKLGSFSLDGCEIYTSCEPCPMCLAAIYWARIDAIYYGNTAAEAARVNFDDAFLYRELALPHQSRSIPSTQLLGDEAWESFQAWQNSASKIHY
ncbi:MAG TPA: nucleoside deaminase [Acidobacteriaceae bacterium]|nr:nucleoside deaminase [Acidobacteriaceae bacterium]